jgi:hypothetical protein
MKNEYQQQHYECVLNQKLGGSRPAVRPDKNLLDNQIDK